MNPLNGLYGAAAALRNTLYDRGVLSSRRLEQPVVSVGNLSVGGSGKTPFVIALGELLKARDIRFDVLSRGYGRKSRGVLVVDADGTAAEFGDEPLLIARRLGVPVIVGESRYDAGRVAEKKFQPQLHILDDGFQHRSLARDFDIVLMTERDFDDRLLPLGRLREPLSSLRRADAIVLPCEFCEAAKSALGFGEGVPQGLKPAFLNTRVDTAEAVPFPKPVSKTNDEECKARWQSQAIESFALEGKLIWRMRREVAISDSPVSPIVFCGIARAQQFFSQVRAAGIEPAAELEFRDHQTYDKRDIERLIEICGKLGAGGFLTTEKDAINLGAFQRDLEPLAVATLSVTFDNPTDVVDTILARIAKRKPRS
jgi:tetraacyldisaccharide 4'-kinase